MSGEDKRNDDESPAPEESAPDAGDEADADDELTVEDILADAPDDGQAAEDTVTVLQATLEERTRDLQRLNAEFQNYRKRVERDKSRAGELATASLLSSLLPILDDLDRARDHGDLTGGFGSVAEQLIGTLSKQGLESFGEKGDGFDPTVHEAVAHMQMADVDGPTCIDVMRRGYRLGERLLRPALVAVAEPLDEPDEPVEDDQPEAAEPPAESETDAAEAADDGDGPDETGAEENDEGTDEEPKAAEAEAESEEDPKGERDA